MTKILLTFILILLLIAIAAIVIIKILFAAKKTLLTEQVAWSAKSIKIIHKKKNRGNSDRDKRTKPRLLEDIAHQSAEFLKDQ